MTDQTTDTPADNAGQVTDTPWYNGVEPETVGYIQNKKWDGKDGPLKALEGYRNLEKFHGVPADQIIKLPRDDDAEAWGKVYQRLGRPESADKYGEVQVPEGVSLNPDLIKQFDDIFFSHNLTKSQRDSIVKAYASKEAEVMSARQKELEMMIVTQREQLKSEWGQKYDERLDLAKRAVRAGLPADVDKDATLAAIEEAVGPVVFGKMFSNLADKMKLGEDIMLDGTKNEGRYGYTKEQAMEDRRMLMAEITGDRNRLDMYNKNTGPDVLKMQRLNEIISR